MCGRFVSTTPAADLAEHFGASVTVGDLPPRWNVAPSSEVWVVHDVARSRANRPGVARTLEPMRWGLVPSWASDPSIGHRLINARSETAATKPSFRSAWRRRRCLLPVDGFYEWEPVVGQSAKQPWFFEFEAGGPMALAGLWEHSAPDAHGETPGGTCTILTRPADAVVAPVHDRMPVVVPPDAWDAWCDPGCDDPDQIVALLGSLGNVPLRAYRVGRAVGNPRNDGPGLVGRID